MSSSSLDENMSLSSDSEADTKPAEDRIILTAETLDAIEIDYDFPDEDLSLASFNDDDFPDDNEFYQAADEELRVVDASEIWAGYGLDEKELAQLTGKPY